MHVHLHHRICNLIVIVFQRLPYLSLIHADLLNSFCGLFVFLQNKDCVVYFPLLLFTSPFSCLLLPSHLLLLLFTSFFPCLLLPSLVYFPLLMFTSPFPCLLPLHLFTSPFPCLLPPSPVYFLLLLFLSLMRLHLI